LLCRAAIGQLHTALVFRMLVYVKAVELSSRTDRQTDRQAGRRTDRRDDTNTECPHLPGRDAHIKGARKHIVANKETILNFVSALIIRMIMMMMTIIMMIIIIIMCKNNNSGPG